MTKAEIMEVLTYLHADFDKEVPEAKLHVWYDQFSHISKRVAWAAARLLLTHKTYGAPRAQDFQDALREVTDNCLITGAEAFERAVAAVKRFGRYQEEAGLSTLPPIVRRTTKAFGWEAICDSEDLSLIRGHFIRTYESVSSQEANDALIAPELKAEIDAIRELPNAERFGISTASDVVRKLLPMIKRKATGT